MMPSTQTELEPRGCIFHILCIHNAPLFGFCEVEHPSEEEDTVACQSLMHTFNRINTKSTNQRYISSVSQTTHIELEQKDCIFHILGIQNAS